MMIGRSLNSQDGGHNVDLVSDPNRSGNHRSIHRGHQTRQHVKRDGNASPSVMAMSHRTIEQVIGRLLTDEERAQVHSLPEANGRGAE
jgi:hypothetical protein